MFEWISSNEVRCRRCLAVFDPKDPEAPVCPNCRATDEEEPS